MSKHSHFAQKNVCKQWPLPFYICNVICDTHAHNYIYHTTGTYTRGNIRRGRVLTTLSFQFVGKYLK